MLPPVSFCFFFNDTATTEIYTLSLHDALPILNLVLPMTPATTGPVLMPMRRLKVSPPGASCSTISCRSEEHTSELQSRLHLVCRLLLEKKKPFEDLPVAWPAELFLLRSMHTTV